MKSPWAPLLLVPIAGALGITTGLLFGPAIVPRDWMILPALGALPILSAVAAWLWMPGTWKKLLAALLLPLPCALAFCSGFYAGINLAFKAPPSPSLDYVEPYPGAPADFIAGFRGLMTVEEFKAALSPEQRASLQVLDHHCFGPNPWCPDCRWSCESRLLVSPFNLDGYDGRLLATFHGGHLWLLRFGLGDNIGDDIHRPETKPDPELKAQVDAMKLHFKQTQCARPDTGFDCRTASGVKLESFDCKLCTMTFLQWQDTRMNDLRNKDFSQGGSGLFN